jgi:hypothetical protein
MSSVSGGNPPPGGGVVEGGGEAQQFGDAVVQNGTVQVAGEELNLATTAGADVLFGAVPDSADLAALKAMLQLKEVEGPDGGRILVPDDSYDAVDKDAQLRLQGPQGEIDIDDLDQVVSGIFVDAGLPDPNGTTTQNTYKAQSGTENFQGAVGALNGYVQNPTQQNLEGFAEYMNRIEAEQPNGNIMEVLFLVFKESIQETNEDKKYFLKKLSMFNDMAEELSGYLEYLTDMSQELSAKGEGKKYPEKEYITIETKRFDLSGVGPDGKLATTKVEDKRVERQGLSSEVKNVEGMQETVRNKRQTASTAFQNFDQKANQLYNLLSSVLKSLNDMRMGTTRNML